MNNTRTKKITISQATKKQKVYLSDDIAGKATSMKFQMNNLIDKYFNHNKSIDATIVLLRKRNTALLISLIFFITVYDNISMFLALH